MKYLICISDKLHIIYGKMGGQSMASFDATAGKPELSLLTEKKY